MALPHVVYLGRNVKISCAQIRNYYRNKLGVMFFLTLWSTKLLFSSHQQRLKFRSCVKKLLPLTNVLASTQVLQLIDWPYLKDVLVVSLSQCVASLSTFFP